MQTVDENQCILTCLMPSFLVLSWCCTEGSLELPLKVLLVISRLLQKILRIYQGYISGLSRLLQKILVIYRTVNSINAQYPECSLLMVMVKVSGIFFWTSITKKEPCFSLLVYL